jgi:long-chain acyl-CoA synthetase
MPRRSLLEYLENFHRHGSETAYAQPRGYRMERWSYREVAETAAQFARELEARRVGRGDRVLLWGASCAEWVAAFFGCLLRGAVVVPMDCGASPVFARRVFAEVHAKLLVSSRELAAGAPDVPVILLETLRETMGRHSGAGYRPPPLGRKDPVEIVFTSGTTTEPKGVVITHGNVLANLEPLEAETQKYLRYEWPFHPIRFLNLLPLSHVFGQFLGLFVPRLLGGTVIFQQSLNPSDILRAVKRERVSVVAAVPRLLHTLKDKLERDYEIAGERNHFQQQLRKAEGEAFFWRWWRFRWIHGRLGWKFWAFVTGGAGLDPETEAFWSRLGFAVVQGYGLTETTSLVSVNHPFRRSKGSIGKVLSGREIKLAEEGEILVQGESVASRYWQGGGLEPVEDEAGWFRTGDVGAFDGNGNLYFKGRRKDVIVTAEGMNIYPEDLEAALRQQPEVSDCAVVGMARDCNAEPCAVLLLREWTVKAQDIVRRANQTLAQYQRMRHWFVWPEEDFPRTSTQKPRTNVIQEVVRAHLDEKAAAPPRGGTLAELIGRFSGRTPAQLFSTARLEEDLNFSSIDRVELLSALEDRYQIDLSEGQFSAATTVAEVELLVRQPRSLPSGLHFPRWTQRPLARWLRVGAYYLLLWPATLLLGYPCIRGREELDGLRGPVLIVANHTAIVDVAFVLAALPARFRHRLAVAAQAERLEAMRQPPTGRGFWRGWLDRLGYWLAAALFSVFPLPRQSGFRESFRFAGESVDRGYSVLIFPEGEYTVDGKVAAFRTGIGLLASKLDIPVVPLRIEGLFQLKQSGKKMARPGIIKVSIGAPVRFAPNTEATEIARELERRVKALGGADSP